jgi:SAM-dependent methyltransferase
MTNLSETTTRPTTSGPHSATELDAIKAKQQAMWSSGDFGIIGTTLQIVGESLCETVDLRSGSRVLDVAAGNGNCSLAAARRFCEVVSTDYVPALLEDGKRRAEGDRLAIEFREADAEALPFADGEFDVVLSSFGVMFAPNHSRAALELLRVCKPGGRIGLANWTPGGFIGQLLKTVGKHVPPSPALTPPTRWGAEDHLQALFGAAASRITVIPREFVFRYRSPEHFIEMFRTWYGPTLKAFGALSPESQQLLAADMRELIARFNRSGDATAVIPSEYVEVVIDKR